MNSDKLKELLDMVHDIFPLPQDDVFKGTHSITLCKMEDGSIRPAINIWTRFEDCVIRNRAIVLDPEEEITKELLERVKEGMYKDPKGKMRVV